MTAVAVKRFEQPDDTFAGERVEAEQVQPHGLTVWRITFKPGWRYTEHMEPNMCQAPHAFYVLSGKMAFKMQDGTEAEAGAGEVAVVEPGHDAWTVGGEACVALDFGESIREDAFTG
jgi:quercetin dioxygenase-like cupin family protein